MTHFIDHTQQVKKQTFDMAVITDASGRKVGKIIIRYTDSQIGYNNETGIVFNAGEQAISNLNFANTKKNDCYDRCYGVYDLLTSIGAKVYGYDGRLFYTYSDKPAPMPTEAQNVDSMSQPQEFESFKLGNRKFNILWV